MARKTIAIFLIYVFLYAAKNTEASEFLWCDRHVESFDEVQSMVNSTDSIISSNELSHIILTAFTRAKCDERITTAACTTCLEPVDIFNVLQLPMANGLNQTQFEDASTIIVNIMHSMETYCPPGGPYWDATKLTYENFTNAQLNYHCEPENCGITFNQHQLEEAMMSLNKTYRPGNIEVLANGTVVNEQNISSVCNGEWPWFRSGDVFESSHVHDAHHGATADELAHLNTDFLARILRGDCMTPDRTADHDGLPNEDDFIKSTFNKFGDGSCIINIDGFEQITQLLGIGGAESEDGDHDHDHDHEHLTAQDANRQVQKRSISTNEETHEHEADGVSVTCYSPEELLEAFNLDPVTPAITRADFERLSTALIQQASEGCQPVETTSIDSAPLWQAYVYGTLGVVCMACCSLIGVSIILLKKTAIYSQFLLLLLGLAVGALVGDALIHIIPQVLGLHSHEGEESGGEFHVEPYVWKMFVAALSIWSFYVLHVILHQRSYSHVHHHQDQSHNDMEISVNTATSELENDKKSSLTSLSNTSAEAIDSSIQHYSTDNLQTVKVTASDKVNNSQPITQKFSDSDTNLQNQADSGNKTMKHATAWMITIGDAIHKFADGIALGAAFSISWESGVSSLIAIICHELPHEFGDVAVMMMAGWSRKKILISQMACILCSLGGLYLGLLLSQIDGASDWILICVAGMFIYIALAEVVPEMSAMCERHPGWSHFLLSNAGIGLGLFLILMVALLEHLIAV